MEENVKEHCGAFQTKDLEIFRLETRTKKTNTKVYQVI